MKKSIDNICNQFVSLHNAISILSGTGNCKELLCVFLPVAFRWGHGDGLLIPSMFSEIVSLSS